MPGSHRLSQAKQDALKILKLFLGPRRWTCRDVVAALIVIIGGTFTAISVPVLTLYFSADKLGYTKISSDCASRPTLNGYPEVEAHEVETVDGVKLTMWRVHGNSSRPVLVMSGLQCSARDWFAGLGEDALPWVFWRAGLDVWFGNNRGTFMTSTPIWNWTFTGMADFDIPAMVDGILRTTGAASVAYIGHSQGALQAFIHFSRNATTADRISHFAAWAPSVYLTQRRFFWNFLSYMRVDVWGRFSTARPGTSFTMHEAMQRHKCYVRCSLCINDMGGSFMEGQQGFASTCKEKFQCIPAGTSSDNMRIFAETLRSGGLLEYLTDTERPLNFANLHMPMSLAVGDMDLFMQPADVRRLAKHCSHGNTALNVQVLPGFGHMDLVWGTKAPELLFKPLAKHLASE